MSLLVLFVLAAFASVGLVIWLSRPPNSNNTTSADFDDDSVFYNSSYLSTKNCSSRAIAARPVSAREAGDPMLGCIYVQPGTRVARGRDWEWGNQDGGAGSIGTIVQDLSAPDSDGWVS